MARAVSAMAALPTQGVDDRDESPQVRQQVGAGAAGQERERFVPEGVEGPGGGVRPGGETGRPGPGADVLLIPDFPGGGQGFGQQFRRQALRQGGQGLGAGGYRILDFPCGGQGFGHSDLPAGAPPGRSGRGRGHRQSSISLAAARASGSSSRQALRQGGQDAGAVIGILDFPCGGQGFGQQFRQALRQGGQGAGAGIRILDFPCGGQGFGPAVPAVGAPPGRSGPARHLHP
jgi:hypothetical protein